MKVQAKQFNISEGERPKILFLGNGILRAYGGEDWNAILDEIKNEDRFPNKAEEYDMPMPLKAAMLADGKLAKKMYEQRKNHFDSFAKCNQKQRQVINQFMSLGFDYVLTTNYSYEIEAALLNKCTLSENDVTKLLSTTGVKNAQTHYFINTFNKVGNNQIWHIHGEARKPSSMIIGQYYYGNLLARYKEHFKYSDKKINNAINKKEPIEINSWLDAFIFGDVYFIGFGFDFSETDLWWLLEKKANELNHGTTVFFNPIEKDSRSTKKVPPNVCKKFLFDTYGVTYKDLGFKIIDKEDYKIFYKKVLDYLEKNCCE